MKKRGIFRLIAVLITILTLTLSGTVYASKTDAIPNPGNIEVMKKGSITGLTAAQMPQTHGYKHLTATGVLGEEVTGERYAIIVGISDYPGPYHVLEGGYDLSYADDDARTVRDVLTGIYGFEDSRISLLIDNEATRDTILSEIASLQEIVNEDDEVVFFFSGHGVRHTTGAPMAHNGGQVGIITWGEELYPAPGFGYIWDRELKQAFKDFETDRIVFMFDSCMAGGMAELGENGRIVCMATTQAGMAIEFGEDYAAYYDTEGVPPLNHGLFTYFLVETGMRTADFYPSDGYVTVEESFDFTRAVLTEMSLTIPDLWQIPVVKDLFPGDLPL